MIREWSKEYGDLAANGLSSSAKNYYEKLNETLYKSQNDTYKLFAAAEQVENEYAKKFEYIAFEMSLYVDRIKALLSVLQPPRPVTNVFDALGFGERLEKAKQEITKILEKEIRDLIANPDKLEQLNLENYDTQAYIGFISDKYRGQNMFDSNVTNRISDIERDLLIMCYEYLHPENAKIMENFLKPISKDSNRAEDVQNIKYLSYASLEPYSTILFQYLPQITIAEYEYTGTQHYNPARPGIIPDFLPDNEWHPGRSIAVNIVSEGLTDPRGPYVVFFHEVGHAMDDMLRKGGAFKRSSSGLQDILYEDTFAKIEAIIMGIDQNDAVVKAVLESFKDGAAQLTVGSYEESVRNDVVEKYRDALTGVLWDEVLTGQSELVTDVLGGYTNNVLGRNIGGFAHDNDYWNDPKRDKPQSSEFFAHYFSAQVTGYEVKDNYLNEYFKKSTDFLDGELINAAEELKK